MPGDDPLRLYTRELIQYGWSEPQPEQPPRALAPDAMRRRARQAMRTMQTAGLPRLLLLGLGTGGLARELATALPDGCLAISSFSPAAARRALLQAGSPLAGCSLRILCDTSPWAHLLLLAQEGFGPDNTTLVLNPETTDPGERRAGRELTRLFAGSARTPLPPLAAAAAPRLSVAAIVRPDEPGLPAFFAQFPSWLHELVVVWDADRVPDAPPCAAPPLRHAARPLELDFSAQRNAMLRLCAGDWILYLDADERLEPGTWAALPRLMAQEAIQGWLLPRQTLYPDQDHCKIGFGLWPDVQLRLFRNLPGLAFANPVHEVLHGLSGPLGVAPFLPILHLSRLLKSREEIQRKLDLFARAGGGRHQLNRDYPRLPRTAFPGPDSACQAWALVLRNLAV